MKIEVPRYKIYKSDLRSKDYLLVIPVINEGEKPAQLINKIIGQGIHRNIDILVVDGGSTDNTISNLDKNYTNHILILNEPGKLGSQLRIAYSFGLNLGYEGIITIDGNGKDSPQFIIEFIKKLQEGYDLVQGSRFIKGGKGYNTPKTRELAIKLIHAPLLSLFSGFKWTDTTQGYRGYSKHLLESDKIAVFRKVFVNYELLAYLNYISPRTGYKCIELPTVRSYPKVGKVPTKIKGFKGNFRVFKSLIQVCLGYYNPQV